MVSSSSHLSKLETGTSLHLLLPSLSGTIHVASTFQLSPKFPSLHFELRALPTFTWRHVLPGLRASCSAGGSASVSPCSPSPPAMRVIFPKCSSLIHRFCTSRGPARKQTTLKSRYKFTMKIGYMGDDRARKTKKRWRGNPEISNNRRKSHHHPELEAQRGCGYPGPRAWAHPAVVGTIRPVQREMRPQLT